MSIKPADSGPACRKGPTSLTAYHRISFLGLSPAWSPRAHVRAEPPVGWEWALVLGAKDWSLQIPEAAVGSVAGSFPSSALQSVPSRQPGGRLGLKAGLVASCLCGLGF